jgi:acyl-CoA thioesterase-1
MAETRHDPRPVLAAYGDSLVAGWGLAPGDALSVRLEAELLKRGRAVAVLDFGVSGDTALDGLDRLPDVLAARPRAVLLEFGANDCYQGIPVEETTQALDQMIHALKDSGAHVLLAGWRTRSDLFKPEFDDPDLAGLVPIAPPLFDADYVERFNRIHADLARAHKLPLMPHILDPLLDPALDGAGSLALFQADGVHPSARGAQLLAEALAPLLLPLL